MSGAGSAELQPLKAFRDRWRDALASRATFVFHCAEIDPSFDPPQQVADDFVAQFGFTPIGFNWEMLDAAPGASGARSAAVVIADAFARDMVLSKQDWLGEERALNCAKEFVAAFRPDRRTVLSNRFDGLWNPISPSTFEWAFVGFDDRKIALLLVMARD